MSLEGVWAQCGLILQSLERHRNLIFIFESKLLKVENEFKWISNPLRVKAYKGPDTAHGPLTDNLQTPCQSLWVFPDIHMPL